ncbi:MAG: purine-nucleoside phosphorylase [Spirochaetales bacterium]|uniref:Uridine phosphorylase n=1 Tax=Candidatus Thalassospirochaeta sargassi TaxID=3119039 RepID=A0AAJ1MLW2_9SPIO|nr:purine-nucleoside phosphorylase [Spirochaetales bacterium]
MSLHIAAEKGAIADTVLMPGDPLRAKYAAEKFLENPVCYNEVRGMYGFTGTYKGKKISIQGSGMGQPSMGIYAYELMSFYEAKTIMRIGSCGAVQPEIELRDIVLAMSASTNGGNNRGIFRGMDFAPCANAELFLTASKKAEEMKLSVKAGNILSSDTFYDEDPEVWKLWAKFGVLAIEMEASMLYTLAAKMGVKALAICTVSDSIVNQTLLSSEDRERSFDEMILLALETAVETG